MIHISFNRIIHLSPKNLKINFLSILLYFSRDQIYFMFVILLWFCLMNPLPISFGVYLYPYLHVITAETWIITSRGFITITLLRIYAAIRCRYWSTCSVISRDSCSEWAHSYLMNLEHTTTTIGSYVCLILF